MLRLLLFYFVVHYKDYYLKTLSTNEGPVVSYTDENSDNKKIKLEDVVLLTFIYIYIYVFFIVSNIEIKVFS